MKCSEMAATTTTNLHGHQMSGRQLQDVGMKVLDEGGDEVVGYGGDSLQLDVGFDQIAEDVGAFDALQGKALTFAHAHWNNYNNDKLIIQIILINTNNTNNNDINNRSGG